MSEQANPKSTDLTIGGDVPPPINAVVLGGIAGLKAKFEQADLDQKRSSLSEAIQYGKEGLTLLWRGLEDADLQVRSHSYFLLKSAGMNSPELEMGIPLRVGDRIYAVYQSMVIYGDDWYYVYNSVIDEEDDDWEDDWEREEYSVYQSGVTTTNNTFEYLSDAPEDNQVDLGEYYPILVCYCIDQIEAEEAAKVAYIEKFENLDCQIYELSTVGAARDIDLKAWVETHKITVDAEVPDYWSDESTWLYNCRVLTSLQKQKRFDLLYELWEQLGCNSLGFVHEYVIDRPCYLRLSNHVRT